MTHAIDGKPGGMRPASLRHAAQNGGWMIAGRAVQALLSLIYLAVAARALGPHDFGQFALILTTGQAVVSLVSFQNWQVIVHFGMADLNLGDHARLRRLAGFSIALDGLSFGVGILIAYAGTEFLAPWLGWSSTNANLAFGFAIVMLASLSSTPIGLLRLFDRYDAAAMAEAVTPVMRVIGALAALASGGGVQSFLLAWAAAELGAAIAYWILAWRTGMIDRAAISPSSFKRAIAEHPGIWRFALLTNAGATLGYARRPAVQLLIGGLAGAAAAGNYRIAQQLSGAVSRLSLILSRALYPEFVRHHRSGPETRSPRILNQALLLALAGGVILVALSALAGSWLLELVVGPAYRDAYPLFLMLSAAAAADLLNGVMESALIATGRSASALWAKLAAVIGVFGLAYPLFRAIGVVGIAAAALFVSLALAAVLLVLLRPRRQAVPA